jgi:sugar phosphate permease
MMLPVAMTMGVAGSQEGRLADTFEPRVILAVRLASLALVRYVFSFVTPLTTAA